MKPPATRSVDLRRSAIREVFEAADARPGTIRLEVGEPSFPTPGHIVDGALEAARSGHTRYTPNGGLWSLRELLAEKVASVDGYDARPEQVVATPGAMNALFSIYLALLEPGDEVLLPTPGFPNMDEMVSLLGGSPVFYRLHPAAGYLPDLAELESLVTPRTKAVFVNTPGNPTGAVFPPELVEQLVGLAAEHDLYLVSDEVYDELVLDDLEHVSAGRFDTDGRVISVYSFSKIYAMTGWRLGYCVASVELAELLRTLQEPEVSCPSTVSQKAAEAALTGPRGPIDAMREAYRARRDLAWRLVTEAGLDAFRTQGTFYMLVDVSTAGMSSREFTMHLLETGGVSVAPGEVFGPAGSGLVRVSLAPEPDELAEGLSRLVACLFEA
ncbi:MAG: pyridoxal phosphate-dependent aminotransferase, partial [Gaiellales bacterium]